MARMTFYMVARRAEAGEHYVLASMRKFYRYSEAELFLLSLAAAQEPIVLMFD